MENDNHELVVKVTPHQLAYMIESFHDFILTRLKWMCSGEYLDWREEVDFDVPQSVVNDMVNMYGYCLQAYRSQDDANQTLIEIVSFSDKQWGLLNTVHGAKTWEDVPVMRGADRDVFE